MRPIQEGAMAKQANTIDFGSSDAWAFGPGTKTLTSDAVSPAENTPAVESSLVVEGPPPYLAEDHEQTAVFPSEPSEPSAAERDVWDQLPAERRRRSRRYVGKHRA
jgi:hypothetical protein